MKFTNKVSTIVAIRKGFDQEFGFMPSLLKTKRLVDAMENSSSPFVVDFVEDVNRQQREKVANNQIDQMLTVTHQFNTGMITSEEYIRKMHEVSSPI